MYNNYSQQEDDAGGIDPRLEAIRFETRCRNFFMDLSVIEEVYEYYRLTDEKEKARQLLAYAVEQYPYNVDVLFLKSLIDFESGELAQALATVDRALALKPEHVGLRLHHARILREQQAYANARLEIELLLNQYPEDPDILFELAALYAEEGQYPQAAAAYSKSITLGGNPEEILPALYLVFENRADTSEGIRCFKQLIDDQPFCPHRWYYLALLYLQQGLYEQALDCLEFTLALDNTYVAAYQAKGLALMELQKYEDALTVLNESLFFDKNDLVTLLRIGECYEELGNPLKARYSYQQCARRYENQAEPYYGIATTFMAEERWQEALYFFEKALEINPEFQQAWQGKANAEFFLGYEQTAFESLSKAISLDPSDIELWQQWAERLEESNYIDQAFDFLADGFRHNPDCTELLYQYASYAFKHNRSRDAFVYLENALLRDFDKHTILFDYYPGIDSFLPIRELIEQYRPR
jgi:tetratricopeptide (TPR) repeat protein